MKLAKMVCFQQLSNGTVFLFTNVLRLPTIFITPKLAHIHNSTFSSWRLSDLGLGSISGKLDFHYWLRHHLLPRQGYYSTGDATADTSITFAVSKGDVPPTKGSLSNRFVIWVLQSLFLKERWYWAFLRGGSHCLGLYQDLGVIQQNYSDAILKG